MPLGSYLRVLSVENVSIGGVLQKTDLEVLSIVDWEGERVIRLEAAAAMQVRENGIKLE